MALKKVWLNGTEHTITLTQDSEASGSMRINNDSLSFTIVSYDDRTNIITFLLDTKLYKAHVQEQPATSVRSLEVTLLEAHTQNDSFLINLSPPKKDTFAPKSTFKPALHAPLSGRVIKTFVHKNQHVKKDEPLLILESMKMENQIVAAHDCQVTQIMIEEGDIVSSKQLLITFSEK